MFFFMIIASSICITTKCIFYELNILYYKICTYVAVSDNYFHVESRYSSQYVKINRFVFVSTDRRNIPRPNQDLSVSSLA